MKKFVIIATVLLLATAKVANAQESFFTINWGIGVPTGDLERMIEKASPSGLTLGGRKFINDIFSVGGYLGWQQYYDKDFGLHAVSPGVDVYGRKITQIDTYPVMASLHVYGGDNGSPRPYIGINTGVTFLSQYEQYGIYEISENSTHFTLAPELGIYLPMGLGGGGLNLSARYDHAFKSSNDYHVQSFIFNIGIAIAR